MDQLILRNSQKGALKRTHDQAEQTNVEFDGKSFYNLL
jgi:hypothetical protein